MRITKTTPTVHVPRLGGGTHEQRAVRHRVHVRHMEGLVVINEAQVPEPRNATGRPLDRLETLLGVVAMDVRPWCIWGCYIERYVRVEPPSPGKSTTTQTPRPTIEGTPARTSAGISVANLGVGGLQQSHVMLGRRNVGTSRQPHDLRTELDEADLDRHALKTLQGIVDVLHERRSVWRIRQGIGAVDVLDVRMPRHPRPPPLL